jgi:hypothetical protein
MSGVAMAKLVGKDSIEKSVRKPAPKRGVFSQLAEAVYVLIALVLPAGGRRVPSKTISRLSSLYDNLWCKGFQKRMQLWSSRSMLVAKGVAFILLCAYICLMAIKTYHRCTEWHDELTLFASALHVCSSLTVKSNYALQFISSDPHHAIPFLGEIRLLQYFVPTIPCLWITTQHFIIFLHLRRSSCNL